MSETKTKNLCTVPAADLTDSQYFIAEDGGELKRIPKVQVVLKKLEKMLATDTENLAGGGEVTAQKLLDVLAEQVANKLLAKSQVVNNLLATVEGNPLDATQGKALKDLIDTTNNNLSRRLLVGDNIASADLLNDIPNERFGTLSMRFSDGTMNQLILLKETAALTIFRNNAWQEQYRFATTSMLSDYISKQGIKFVEQYLKSTQTLSPSGTTLLNDASITIPFDCIAILTWKLHCKSSEQKASLYYMVNKAYVQGRHQWDGTIQTDETVNIFAMGRFSKDQELTVSVQGNCSVVGNNTSLTRYSFVFIPI